MALALDPRDFPIEERDLPDPPAPPGPGAINIPQIINQLAVLGLSPLENEQYNKDIVGDTILRNLYPADIPQPVGPGVLHHQGEVINALKMQKDLSKVFEKGLKIALVSEEPSVSARAAISTITSKAADMIRDGIIFDGINVGNRIQEAINSEISGVTLANLHYEDVLNPNGITAMFGPLGQELIQKNNLSVQDMDKVSGEYKKIIDDVHNRGVAANRPQREISNVLRQLSRWVDDHVENDQLKRILKNDARRVSGHRLSELGFRISNLVPETIPLTVGKDIEIESDIAKESFELFLSLIETIVRGTVNDRTAARNLIGIVSELNQTAKLHRIRSQGPAIQGVVPPPEVVNIQLRSSDNTPKSINEIIREIEDIRDNLKNPRVTFTRLATPETGISGISENQFIQNLRNTTKALERKARRQNIRKSTMPKVHKITKLGSILIRGDATNKREIHIKPTAKKEDLMKLVYLLLAEDGTLDDAHHQMLIKIKKGMDAAGIYSVIMQELSKNLGHEFFLVYHPDSPVGGHFLDGFMSVFNHRPLIHTAPSLHGGRLSLGSITSSGFIHSDPRQIFLNMPLSSFTPYRPAVLTNMNRGSVLQPINLLPPAQFGGSVSNISRIPIDVF